MMTDSPAAVASRAARSLLRMPPVPSVLWLLPAMSMTELSMWPTVAIISAFGSLPGSPLIKAVNDGQQDQQRRLQAGS